MHTITKPVQTKFQKRSCKPTFQYENRLLPVMLLEYPLEEGAARRQDEPVRPEHASLTRQRRVRERPALVQALEQPRQIRQVVVPRQVERFLPHFPLFFLFPLKTAS